MKKKVIVLKKGQRLRSKRSKTVYEIRSIRRHSAILMSEEGKYMIIPMTCIISDEFEPVYD